MWKPVDAFGKEIRIGDTVIVARTWGRSCTLGAGIVKEFKDTKSGVRLVYELVLDKGRTVWENSTDYFAPKFGDTAYVSPYNGYSNDMVGVKYDKVVCLGYGFDHDPETDEIIGEILVK